MVQKTSIVFFLPRYHTNLLGLTNGLIKSGCKVHIYCLRKYPIEDYNLVNPVLIPRLKIYARDKKYFSGESLKILDTPSIWFIYNTIKRSTSSFVVIRFEKSIFSIICILVSILLMKKKVLLYNQRVLPERNLFLLLFQKFFYILLGWKTFSPVKSDSYLDDSKFNKWIPFSSYVEANITEKKWDNKELHITTISKLVERKNINLVIESFQTLSIPNIRLNLIIVVTNNNHRKFYKKNIERLEKSKNIYIYKNIKYSKVQKILKNSHVFMLVSKNEPASVSHLEAMAGGNALILGKDNGTFNYLDENGGFIVDYELENITQILVKLLGNRILLKKMGKYNLDKVQKHFHSTKVSKTFLDYLTK